MSMNAGKVYVMKGDEVMAVANTSTQAITAANLAEPMEYSRDMAGPMMFDLGPLSMKNLCRSFRKFVIREQKRHHRFVRQMAVLQRNEHHCLVIRRCLRYGDRVSRKYRRAYGEVIRSMRSIEEVKML